MSRDNVGQVISKVNTSFDDTRKKAMAIFESQLADIGLSKNQIETQNLEQLKQSLERVNEAIRNPDAFGTVKLKASAEAGAIVVTTTSDFHYEVGILPLLLERKKLILDRITLLKGDEKIESLRDLVKKVSDEDVRSKLEDEINTLESESKNLREQVDEVDKAQKQQELEIQAELAKMARETELLERRTKIWLRMIEKESVATIVGSFLLILITCSLITAMFSNPIIQAFSSNGTEIVFGSDILNNAFLLILGYFFGQTVAKASAKQKGDD